MEKAERTPLLPTAAPEEVGVSPEGLCGLDRLLRMVVPNEIPGAVAAVARRGRLVFYEAYGYAQFCPEKRPMKLDTLFDLASLTKVVATTPVVLSLVEEGTLRLDDPAALFVPDFGLHGKEAVTIRQLLCHTAGLYWWRDFYRTCRNRAEIIAAICREKLSVPPGSKVVYSDLGFMLLTEIIERITGMDLARVAREMVFAPLRMGNASFNPGADAAERTAATEYLPERGVLCGVVHDENARAMGGVSGHAGLFGTAMDLLRYGQAWLNGGVLDGASFLSPASIRLAVTEQTAGLNERRGLGWLLKAPVQSPAGDLLSPRTYGHTGFTGTSLFIDPEVETVAVLLTNRVHPSRENAAIFRLRPRFHNLLAAAVTDAGDRRS